MIYPLYEIHGSLVYFFVYFFIHPLSTSRLFMHYSNSSGIDALPLLFLFLLLGAFLLFPISFPLSPIPKKASRTKQKTKNRCPFLSVLAGDLVREGGEGAFSFLFILNTPLFFLDIFYTSLVFFSGSGAFFSILPWIFYFFFFFFFLVFFFLSVT